MLLIRFGTMLFTVLLLFTSDVSAQDFRAGFIVKADGDSIDGYIQNRTKKKNAKKARFRSSKRSRTTEYQPSDLKSYGIYDYKQYRSGQINVNGKKGWIFLEVIVEGGKMDLLGNRGIYYIEKDSLIEMPQGKTTTVRENDRTFKRADNRYVAILNANMVDCNLTANNVDYGERDLVEKVNEYNTCSGAGTKEIKGNVRRNKVGWTIITGYDKSSISISHYEGNTRLVPLDKYKINTSVSVPVGVGVEWSRPRANDKLSFSVEFWYNRQIYQGYAQVSSYGIVRSDLVMDLSTIKTPVSFRFNLRQERNTPYLRLGYTHYIPVSQKNKLLNETEVAGTISTSHYESVKLRPREGFWGGIGYSVKLFGGITCFAEARYEMNLGRITYTIENFKAIDGANYSSQGKVLNFLFGIKF